MTRHQLTPTLTALNREWSALCHEHPDLPATWRLACGTIAAGARLGDLPRAVSVNPDPVLLGLLTLHRAGDALAGRVVVQVMLGKLVLMAVRDAEASLPDYVAAMWERVSSYPVNRRHRRVAANLALDTLKTVKSNQRQLSDEMPVWHPDAAGVRGAEAASGALDDAEEVLAEGVRIGAITELTRATMRCVYVEGRSGADAAAILGASPAAVRQRCAHGVRSLRAVAPALVQRLAG